MCAAIKLKQLCKEKGQERRVVLLEKGAGIGNYHNATRIFVIASIAGNHILSGAVIDPRYLTELLPDWKAQGVCVIYYCMTSR